MEKGHLHSFVCSFSYSICGNYLILVLIRQNRYHLNSDSDDPSVVHSNEDKNVLLYRLFCAWLLGESLVELKLFKKSFAWILLIKNPGKYTVKWYKLFFHHWTIDSDLLESVCLCSFEISPTERFTSLTLNKMWCQWKEVLQFCLF